MELYSPSFGRNWLPVYENFPSWFSLNKTLHPFEVLDYTYPQDRVLNTSTNPTTSVIASSILVSGLTLSNHDNPLAKYLEIITQRDSVIYNSLLQISDSLGVGAGTKEEGYLWVGYIPSKPSKVEIKTTSGWKELINLPLFEALKTPQVSWQWEENTLYVTNLGYVSGSVVSLNDTTSGLPSGWAGEGSVFALHSEFNSLPIIEPDYTSGALPYENIQTVFYKKSGYLYPSIEIRINSIETITLSPQKIWTSLDGSGLTLAIPRLENEPLRNYWSRLEYPRNISPNYSSSYYCTVLAGVFNQATRYSTLEEAPTGMSFYVNTSKYITYLHPKIKSVTDFSYDSSIISNYIGKRGWGLGDPLLHFSVSKTYTDEGQWLGSEDNPPIGVSYSGVSIDISEKEEKTSTWDYELEPGQEFEYF